MSTLKTPVSLQTAFGEYIVSEQLGEGGAGRVYGGVDSAGGSVAIKVLTQTNTEKRRRFKNEIAFLARNTHPNIVTVTDHGVAASGSIAGPFYVMRRYAGNMRTLVSSKIPHTDVLRIFSQILDGVEAAHLLGATHRDLKPENILVDGRGGGLAVADFGVASFTDELLVTLVNTGPQQRLANFLYAAPEQRTQGKSVSSAADIYALGLMLNEMFTSEVPHGTDYRTIASVASDYGFLDKIVADMIKQNPKDRPESIARIKVLIQKYREEAVSLQRLDRLKSAVVRTDQIDEPLALNPPALIDASWENGTLRLVLDQPVTDGWIHALRNMGNFTSLTGAGPDRFHFTGNFATVQVDEGSAQMAIDYFKSWLPIATRVLKQNHERMVEKEAAHRRDQLKREREAEERNLRVNQGLRI